MNHLLMHKNLPVAKVVIQEEGTIVSIEQIYEEKHLPIGIMKKGMADKDLLNEWWIGRSIPASRSGIREALELLNVEAVPMLLLKCFGLSLSDQYWMCPEEQKIRWEEINFFDNEFSDDVGNALFGRNSENTELNLMSPDNTSDGWLKKSRLMKYWQLLF